MNTTLLGPDPNEKALRVIEYKIAALLARTQVLVETLHSDPEYTRHRDPSYSYAPLWAVLQEFGDIAATLNALRDERRALNR